MAATLFPTRGRPSRVHLAVLQDDARVAAEELEQHRVEAIAFVDGCVPLLDAIERVLIEFDPRLHALVRQLAYRHDRYLRRHLPDPDEPSAEATEMAA